MTLIVGFVTLSELLNKASYLNGKKQVPEKEPDPTKEDYSVYRDYVKYSDAGIKFTVYILLGLFCGQWLDKKLGMKGLLTIMGMFLGAAAGTYTLYKSVFEDEK